MPFSANDLTHTTLDTYLRGSGLCDINVAEANVVELQGSRATHLGASWLVLLVAGIVGWAVTQGL